MIDLQEQLTAIRERLNGMEEETEGVLRRAIRNAGTSIRKSMINEARERYAVIDKKLLKSNALRVTQQKNAMSVTLRSKGRPNDLAKFEHAPNPGGKTPVSARVLAQNAMKQISGTPKPFVVEMRNGHVAIMRRVPGETYKSGMAYAARKMLGWDLTRIESLYTISTPQMFSSDDTIDAARHEFMDVLPGKIEQQIAKLLKKKGTTK